MKKRMIQSGILILLLIIGLGILNSGATKAATVSVKKCFECHEEETKEWKTGPHAKTLQELKKTDRELKPECLACHSSDYELSKKDSKPTVEEVEHGVNCLSCHSENLKVTEKSITHADDYKVLRRKAEKLCINCHSAKLEGKVAKFEEGIEHSQQNIFYGFGGIGIKEQLSEKSKAGVNCIDCHMLAKKGGTNRAHTYKTVLPGEGEPNSCINGECHQNFSNSMLTGVIDMRQREIKGLLKEVKAELDVKEKYKDTEAYQAARINYELVKEDKSYGVHNIYYARNLLWEAKDQLDILEKNDKEQQE